MDDAHSKELDSSRPQRWQRFTLLDALLLQAGFAAGFGLAGSAVRWPGQPLTSEDFLAWVIGGLHCGAILSGPLILTVQRVFRGRRESLSRWETLWLWLSLIPISTFLLFGGPWGSPDSFYVAYLISVLCPLLFVLVMAHAGDFQSTPGRERAIPCWWTDRFGFVWVAALVVFDLVNLLALALRQFI